MELLILLIMAVVLVRIIVKASSFFIRLLVLGLLVFGVWYFKYDILDQLDQWSQTFHLENWFSSFFELVENVWQGFLNWLEGLI